MISYLKVIHNPDDSISLLRVINTPVRGIGKTTIETVERVALETGLSLWGAIGESIRRQLLPQRALLALKGFHDLIEDARAILAGTYVERLEQTARESESAEAPAAIAMDDQITFDPTVFESNARESNPEVASPRPDEAAPESLPVASTAELLKFLIDRTGYIKQLEDEDTPEAYSRIASSLRHRGSTPFVSCVHDARDGYAHSFASGLPPALRNGSAGSQRPLSIAGGSARRIIGRRRISQKNQEFIRVGSTPLRPAG